MPERSIIKTVTSGHPDKYPDVQIYDSTLDHIRDFHPEEHERIEEVYKVIEAPDRIHKSKKDGRALLLTSDDVRHHRGDPLRVVVKVVNSAEAIMSTAYFTSSKDHGELIWERTRDDK